MAAAEDRLAFAVPNVPLASIIDLGLQGFPVAPVVKMALRATGTGIQDATASFERVGREWACPAEGSARARRDGCGYEP